MPWYWPTSSTTTAQTWVSTIITTTMPTGTTTSSVWPYTSTTSSTAGNSAWAMNNNVWYQDVEQQWHQEQQAALQQQLYAQQQDYQNQGLVGLGLGAWHNQHQRVYAPAIITHQEQQRRDEELYRRALAAHDEQEATRIRLQIEFRERTQAEQQRVQAAHAQANREAQQQRQAADVRAHELLLEHLTPEQRDTLKKAGWFVVQGGKSGKSYRINSGHLTANIDVIGARHRLCAHVPAGRVPMGDQLLAQKMMLEYDEDAFLRVANRHG